jgi:hypothetical protein
MTSDNLVEGLFGWMKEERALGSAYFFTKAIFIKSLKMQNNLYTTAQAAVLSGDSITARARDIFDHNKVFITTESYTVITQTRNPPTGLICKGHSSRIPYNVDFERMESTYFIPWV